MQLLAALALVIGVDYVHGGLHVHYDLPAQLGQASTLRSLKGEPVSWEIAVTPYREGHGIYRFHTVVKEDRLIFTEVTMQMPLGESAVLKTGDGTNDYTLMLAPVAN